MKHQGRGVIRVNDKTDHGGEVISATSGTEYLSKVSGDARTNVMRFLQFCQ